MSVSPARRVLIVMRGGPGVGMSTLARAIAGSLNIPLIDKGDIKDVIDPAFSLAWH
jgi:adenylate kinase family enzyme